MHNNNVHTYIYAEYLCNIYLSTYLSIHKNVYASANVVCVCMCVCTHMTNIHIDVCVCVCIYIHDQYMYIPVCVCVCVCVRVCLRVYSEEEWAKCKDLIARHDVCAHEQPNHLFRLGWIRV